MQESQMTALVGGNEGCYNTQWQVNSYHFSDYTNGERCHYLY